MKAHGFIGLLLLAILVARVLPEGPGILMLGTLTNIGIGGIFFFYGLKLSPSDLRNSLFNYRVHLLVQFTTFLLFPLLVMSLIPLFEDGSDSQLWLALFFLGTLPSTVNASVVMVSIARGNIPAAIFNASLSGLLGVVLTPAWMSIFLEDTGDFDFFRVIQKLFIQVILPLSLGIILQKKFGALARKNARRISYFDKTVIVLIVYSSFSNAFINKLFQYLSVWEILKLAGMIFGLFLIVYFGTGYVAKLMKLPLEDQIAARFAGTKKSLVHGSAMVKIMFGSSAGNVLFLLPIMLYHILQLLLIAAFAEKYRRRKTG